MSLFQLDPPSIAARAKTAVPSARVPDLVESVVRGLVGFTLVSVAGFAPWAFFGWWFGPGRGEVLMYATCTAVFLGLSGLFLHRLIIGPGSLPRFYKLFGLAFGSYAIVWTVFWMCMPNDTGGMLGLLGGTVAMGLILALAFDAVGAPIAIIAVLFLLNYAGYQAGGWVTSKLMALHLHTALLMWGVCYGIGLGAGLGYAFHRCQRTARTLLGS